MLTTAQACSSGTRVYLCGRVAVERGEQVVRDGALGGAQCRLLLAFLGTRRIRPASRLETVHALWGNAAAGNRAEALRVFARCRRLFRDELGADPSDQTTEIFLSILRSRS